MKTFLNSLSSKIIPARQLFSHKSRLPEEGPTCPYNCKLFLRGLYGAERNIAGRLRALARDHEGWAELCDPLAMRSKIYKRNIDDYFRQQINLLFDHFDTIAGLQLWVGMFSVKGGRSGLVWVDKQLIMVVHNQFKSLYAELIIGDDVKRLSDFDVAAHPITRKPFAQPKTSTIIGKSIDVFGGGTSNGRTSLVKDSYR